MATILMIFLRVMPKNFLWSHYSGPQELGGPGSLNRQNPRFLRHWSRFIFLVSFLPRGLTLLYYTSLTRSEHQHFACFTDDIGTVFFSPLVRISQNLSFSRNSDHISVNQLYRSQALLSLSQFSPSLLFANI